MSDASSPAGASARRAAATSLDVARLAGVAQPTVSLVLGGRGDQMRVAANTQHRILLAAETLGYIPNHAARSLQRKRSNVVTIVSPSLDNPFFPEVIGAVQDAAMARGFSTNAMLARDAGEEAKVLAHILAGAADGVVLASHYAENDEAVGQLARRRIPCVALQRDGRAPPVASVSIDLEAGGGLATQHLVALGHRRIAHVTPPLMQAGRQAGYRRALREADLACDPRLIVETDNTLGGGSAAALSLTGLGREAPTAIFAYNDQLAFGILHALARVGCRVPADVAVVGFDNTVASAFSYPELTTIAHERNRLAVELLFEMLDGEPIGEMHRVVPVRIVVRESCGARASLQ